MTTAKTTMVSVVRRKPASTRCRPTTVRSTRTQSGGRTTAFPVGSHRPDAVGWPARCWCSEGDCRRSSTLPATSDPEATIIARLISVVRWRRKTFRPELKRTVVHFLRHYFFFFDFSFLYSTSALLSSCVL